MIKMYDFDYNFHSAECTFKVDLNKFTIEMALNTLEFFSWDYDKDNDPIDEVMMKYAKNCMEKSTEYSLYGLKNAEFEGFYTLNGEYGITLTRMVSLELDEEDINSNTRYE